MRVLICGSRDFFNASEIREVVYSLPPDTTIIHGNAEGADTIAHRHAIEREMRVEVYPAKWATHGRAAGPIRNTQMLEEGRPDIVYAFYSRKELSRGTADMVRQARRAGVKVVENQ